MAKTDRVLVTSQTPPDQGNGPPERISTFAVLAWFAVAIYLIYEVSVVELIEVPQPFWDLFSNSKGQGGRVAIFYLFGSFLLAPIVVLLTYIVLKFGITMMKEGLLKLFPASWVAIVLPLILLLALVPGFAMKHEIKLLVLSAYAQANDAMRVARGFNPIVRVNEKDSEGNEEER